MAAQRKFDCFPAFVSGDWLGLEFSNFGADRGGGGFAFVGISYGSDAEKTGATGCVVAGTDGMDESLILLDFAIETRAATLTGNDGKYIQRRYVGIGCGRYVPSEIEMRELHRRIFVAFAEADLRRFDRNGGRLNGVHFEILGEFAEARFDGGGVDVADDDEDEIVRDVIFFVVVDDIVASDAVVNVGIADDGVPVRMRDEGGVPLESVGAAAEIVYAHGHFAEDDLFFFEEFVRRDGGVHHAIG